MKFFNFSNEQTVISIYFLVRTITYPLLGPHLTGGLHRAISVSAQIGCDFKKATAIVVGTEATGLSEKWLATSTQNIIIPMQGEIDSMNVSVAAGILIFEAKRQRNFL